MSALFNALASFYTATTPTDRAKAIRVVDELHTNKTIVDTQVSTTPAPPGM